MIKSFPRRKSPRRNGFTAEFYQPLSQHQWSPNYSIKQKGKKYYQIHSMKPILQWYQNWRKLYINFFDKYRQKIFNKILANWIQQCIKKTIHHDHVGFVRHARMLQHTQINKCDTAHKQSKEKIRWTSQ
jgi:hypothetical protein